ncbi:hypothetical protein BGY98DRAFT_959328, partial [Russula aff. rugulosa BPL654]
IFERAGLTPLVLTRAEVSCAERTPGIKWTTFVKLFGGALNSEWPQCSKVPGYEDFACTTVSAQPFMPLVPGKPGLLLQLPAVIEAPQSNHDKSTFHIFSTMQTVADCITGESIQKFPFLKSNSHGQKWFRRVGFRNWYARAIRARIELRNKIKREPSASEVQAYMLHQFTDQITYKDISAAFRSGEEKLTVVGIECMEYDSHLATMVQRQYRR